MNINNNNNFKSFQNFLDFYKKDLKCDFQEVLKEALFDISKQHDNIFSNYSSEDNHKLIKNKYIHKFLFDNIVKFCENTGKMQRPLTCLLSYLSCGGDSSKIDEIVPIALSIELFQNSALIHDDIADEAKLRRGVECLHVTYGIPIALYCGNYFIGISNYIIHKYCKNNLIKSKILYELNNMQLVTCQGQVLDISFSKQKHLNFTEEEYIFMAKNKTAFYSFVAPCIIGAICTNSTQETINSLKSFGIYLGLAFQIMDDIANLDKNVYDKDYLSDIKEGKITLITTYAINHLCSEDSLKLKKILKKKNNPSEQLFEALQLINKCGAIKYAQNKAKEFCLNAKDTLKSANLDNLWSKLLFDMPNWVLNN